MSSPHIPPRRDNSRSVPNRKKTPAPPAVSNRSSGQSTGFSYAPVVAKNEQKFQKGRNKERRQATGVYTSHTLDQQIKYIHRLQTDNGHKKGWDTRQTNEYIS